MAKERGCFILAILKRFPMKWWNVEVSIAIGLRHWNYPSLLEYKQKQRKFHPMSVACMSLAKVVASKAIKKVLS
ncbi:hypothetical protein IEQ34_000707 [Dendrobium chrysotoxum]|uniref:Uncharacterized protein n=1 Tax=Dendrobium chrysotoxum TaxID=161865 RepID=A0AAV7HAZ8_DENCH|nr:hypothetical protein IEQ34_000707 [Dendrobium chrysotoxum]